MAKDHVASPGDCISSVAHESGFFWETIWNHPKNAELKSKRKEPNIIEEGDVIHVPDLTQREFSGATQKRHSFVLRGVPAKLRLRIMEEPKPEEPKPAGGVSSAGGGGGGSFLQNAVNAVSQAVGLGGGGGSTSVFEEPDPEPVSRVDKPRKNVPYVLEIDGKVTNGNTDGDGRIEFAIPPNAKEGKLILEPGTTNERTVALNLGHLNPVTENSGIAQRLNNLGFPCGDGSDAALLGAATRAFQEKSKLQVTGEADAATRDKLRDLHGS